MNTKIIHIGGFDHIRGITIGGGKNAVIQTMWKSRLLHSDLEGEAGKKTLSRIENLGELGCSLLRFAVPDMEAAEVLGRLAELQAMPLVADIHFDYKIALRILDFPIAKIRINPGNIGSKDKIEQVLTKARNKNVPIRIGVNGGSLPVDLRRSIENGELDRVEALVKAAERELDLFDEAGFSDVVVSIKASNVYETIAAARLFRSKSDVPLHIGVTEAGPLIAGVVRNTAALYSLLCEGIGDTVRISLSDTMKNEVIAAREILLAVNESKINFDSEHTDTMNGVKIISCPRCGRAAFDTHSFTEKWQSYLYTMKKNIMVAIMGCAVNGPEEARHADLGITGLGSKVQIFRKGIVVRSINADEADKVFKEELEKIE